MTSDKHHGDSAQIERAMDAANVHRDDQHGEQMGGISDIEATQVLHGKALLHGYERMTRIEVKLEENTSATKEVLEIVSMGKSFFKVLGVIGSAVKWLAGITAACGAVWAAWTHK